MSYSASLFLAFLLAIFNNRPFRCLMACWLESYCSFWGDGSLPLKAILIKSTDTIVKVSLSRPFSEFPHEFSHLRQGCGPSFTCMKWSMGKWYAHSQCWQQPPRISCDQAPSFHGTTLLFIAVSPPRTWSFPNWLSLPPLVPVCCHYLFPCFPVWLLSLLFAHTDEAQWIPNSVIYFISMQLA